MRGLRTIPRRSYHYRLNVLPSSEPPDPNGKGPRKLASIGIALAAFAGLCAIFLQFAPGRSKEPGVSPDQPFDPVAWAEEALRHAQTAAPAAPDAAPSFYYAGFKATSLRSDGTVDLRDVSQPKVQYNFFTPRAGFAETNNAAPITKDFKHLVVEVAEARMRRRTREGVRQSSQWFNGIDVFEERFTQLNEHQLPSELPRCSTTDLFQKALNVEFPSDAEATLVHDAQGYVLMVPRGGPSVNFGQDCELSNPHVYAHAFSKPFDPFAWLPEASLYTEDATLAWSPDPPPYSLTGALDFRYSGLYIDGIRADGLLDLSAHEESLMRIEYTSLLPNAVSNGPEYAELSVRVVRPKHPTDSAATAYKSYPSTRGMQNRLRETSTKAPLAMPTCRATQLWEQARGRGFPTDRLGSLQHSHDGYLLRVHGPDGSHTASFDHDCRLIKSANSKQ